MSRDNICNREGCMGVGDLLLRIQGSSRGFATTPRFFTTTSPLTILCLPSMIIPTPLPEDVAPSPVLIPLLVFLIVLALLVTIPALVAWWLGLKSLMSNSSPQTLHTVTPPRMTDSGCYPVQELGLGRTGQDEGDLGAPKSSGIFSIWANWIGRRTTNLLCTLSNLSDTLQL